MIRPPQRSMSLAVQRLAPPATPQRTVVTMPLEQVRPVIRIAHRLVGPIVFAERIITDHELVVLLRGHGHFIMRDGSLPLASHHLLLIPAWLPHGFACETICEHVAVHFDFAPGVPRSSVQRRPPYEIRLAPDLELPLELRLTPSDGIEAAVIALVRDWSVATPAGRLAAQSRLALLLAGLVRPRQSAPLPASGSPLAPSGIALALDLMQSRFGEAVTMGDCARVSGLSSTRFAHRFRDLTGYAPMEYLRRIRIEHARQLLADPTLSIREIAERCGFPDPYHFSRVFRAVDGLSPTLYRDAVLAGQDVGPTAGHPTPVSRVDPISHPELPP